MAAKVCLWDGISLSDQPAWKASEKHQKEVQLQIQSVIAKHLSDLSITGALSVAIVKVTDESTRYRSVVRCRPDTTDRWYPTEKRSTLPEFLPDMILGGSPTNALQQVVAYWSQTKVASWVRHSQPEWLVLLHCCLLLESRRRSYLMPIVVILSTSKVTVINFLLVADWSLNCVWFRIFRRIVNVS